MPDRDHVAAPDEQVRLAKGDAPVDHLGGPGDHEESFAILLELGPLVRLQGILDGKLMQAELRLELAQEVEAGLMQADPDHVAGPAGPFAGVLDADVGDPAPAQVRG